MVIFHSYGTVCQRVNIHFPLGFPIVFPFSHGFPMVFQVEHIHDFPTRRRTGLHHVSPNPAAPKAGRSARSTLGATWRAETPHRSIKASKDWDLFIWITSSTAQGGGGSFKNRKPIGKVGCCESGMAERIH